MTVISGVKFRAPYALTSRASFEVRSNTQLVSVYPSLRIRFLKTQTQKKKNANGGKRGLRLVRNGRGSVWSTGIFHGIVELTFGSCTIARTQPFVGITVTTPLMR